VHLHEIGECSAPDGSSAGPHYDPDRHPHGGPGRAPHHAGDFGNMSVGTDGHGYLELVSQDLTLNDGPRSIIGRSLVVHEKADDLASQPAGNSGARIACGVVVRSAP
jgi:Cu-Zn family superoxide dismutase